MQEALRIARLGGRTSPNPMVGAVIVRGDKIIGKGYHKGKGTPHAEIAALKKTKTDTKGAALYVNLEPCCHWGTTPPCTEAIIKAGIKEVHASIIDPAKWVNGKGIKELENAGIKVVTGECKDKAEELNEAYLKYIKTGFPFVTLKAAMTLDGKIASSSKVREWITNSEAQKFVHTLRARVDAILIGKGTIQIDNPKLTVRLVKGKNPLRIVLDSDMSIPRSSKVFGQGCIIATTSTAQTEIPNAKLWKLSKDKTEKIDLSVLLKKAGEEGIQSILIEGGEKVFTRALASNIVDKVYFIIAPKITGGGLSVTGDLGIKKISDSINLTRVKFVELGDNIVIEGYIKGKKFNI